MTFKEIIDYAKKDKFWYAQAECFLQPCLSFSYGFALAHKVLPMFLKQFIFSLEKDQCYQANGIKDAEKPSRFFIKLWEENKNYYQEITEQWKQAEQIQDKIVKILEKSDLKRMDNKELDDLYSKLQNASINVWKYLELPEMIGIFEQEIFPSEVMKKLRINEKDYIKIAAVLTTPRQISFARKFEKSLRKIKESIDEGKNPAKQIENLIKNYYWIRSGYHGAPMLKKKEILQEVHGYKKSIYKANTLNRQSIIKTYKIPFDVIETFDFIALMAYWRDERKRISLPVIFWTFKICDEVARRNKINVKLVYNLTIEEMRKLILNQNSIPAHTSPDGHVSFSITQYGIQFFYGKEHEKIFRTYFRQDKLANTVLSGMMVSRAGEGKIQGIARVIFNPLGAKFKEGEILITPMTRPEFVPLMKKALAVVTDQGGLTCHAAIVSRELGISCLVGTRFASKIIKDGDLVELNTNHGTVKKI